MVNSEHLFVVRIIETPSVDVNTSGRVEIYHGFEWGTLCSLGWDDEDANIVCKQLGFITGRNGSVTWAAGTGVIWMSNIQCQGTEGVIQGCLHNGWNYEDLDPNVCDHNADVQISCFAHKGLYLNFIYHINDHI